MVAQSKQHAVDFLPAELTGNIYLERPAEPEISIRIEANLLKSAECTLELAFQYWVRKTQLAT